MSVVRFKLNSFFILLKFSMLNKLVEEMSIIVDKIRPITKGITVFITDLK